MAQKHAQLAKLYAQNVLREAIEKCTLKEAQFILKDPFYSSFITSKDLLEDLRLALQYQDTLSFRYKHEKIVHLLLTNPILSLEDLCAQDETGSTLLHLVIKRGDFSAVKYLVGRLPLEHLLLKDNKGRTPMHLAARYKSKKIFSVLFNRLNDLKLAQVIEELLKADNNEYSVIESSYLPKNRNFSALLHNSHVQLSTFYRKGSEMFKHILKILPYRLNHDQLVTIAIGLEELLESETIDKGYAATLRSILKRYIEAQYGCNADKIIRFVAYRRYLSYIEKKYGRNAKEVIAYLERHKKLDENIKKRYPVEVDEGYGSGTDSLSNIEE